jgi:hypothetical protein
MSEMDISGSHIFQPEYLKYSDGIDIHPSFRDYSEYYNYGDINNEYNEHIHEENPNEYHNQIIEDFYSNVEIAERYNEYFEQFEIQNITYFNIHDVEIYDINHLEGFIEEFAPEFSIDPK